MRNAIFGIAAAMMIAATPASARPITTYRVGPIGYACSIELEFRTGGDDLRGGNDNLQAWIQVPFGETHTPTWLSLTDLINVGAGGLNNTRNWANWSTHTVSVPLPDCSIRTDTIHGIRLSTRARGGISGDNWNLQSITVGWRGTETPPLGRGPPPRASGQLFKSYEPRAEAFLFRFTGEHSETQFNW